MKDRSKKDNPVTGYPFLLVQILGFDYTSNKTIEVIGGDL
jgi:hypothetical protein